MWVCVLLLLLLVIVEGFVVVRLVFIFMDNCGMFICLVFFLFFKSVEEGNVCWDRVSLIKYIYMKSESIDGDI